MSYGVLSLPPAPRVSDRRISSVDHEPRLSSFEDVARRVTKEMGTALIHLKDGSEILLTVPGQRYYDYSAHWRCTDGRSPDVR